MTRYSGRVVGAHQHIDRVARRHLTYVIGDNSVFPAIRSILRFEGKNGPDGIKVKSPAKDEPWHYLNPMDGDPTEFLKIITNHYEALVKSLREKNKERSAFEAAWLAHAIVDGLTPAHHYPYEETIEKLRKGKTKESRTTYKEKLLFKGDTFGQTLNNTYKVYGPKGLFTAHHTFEFGVMLLFRPLRLADAKPTKKDMKDIRTKGIANYFLDIAREVAVLDLFNDYLKNGWTSRLSNRIRHELAPRITKVVTLTWYCAVEEAGLCE